MVEQHHVGILRLHHVPDLLGLAGTDEIAGMGCGTAAGDDRHRLGAGRHGEITQFIELFPIGIGRKIEMDEDGAFAAPGTFKQSAPSSERVGSGRNQAFPLPSSLMGSLTLRAGTTVEIACL